MAKDEIQLPQWPMASFYDRINAENSVRFLDNYLDEVTSLHEFRGVVIGKVIEFENCMDVLILNLLSESEEEQKKLYEYFWLVSKKGLANKNAIFSKIILTEFNFNSKFKERVQRVLVLLSKFISLRNILAHGYLKEIVIKDQIKIEINGSPNSVLITADFKADCKRQMEIISNFFEYLKYNCKDRSQLYNFYFYANHSFFIESHLLSDEERANYKDKETLNCLTNDWKRLSESKNKLGVFALISPVSN